VVETGRRRRWSENERLKIVLENPRTACRDLDLVRRHRTPARPHRPGSLQTWIGLSFRTREGAEVAGVVHTVAREHRERPNTRFMLVTGTTLSALALR
jgi:hypothetical protein